MPILVSCVGAETIVVSGELVHLYTTVILVDCDHGNDSNGCGSSSQPCKTLAQAASALENNTLIYIPNSSECQLTQLVNITGYNNNIGIVGNANLTIKCSQKEAGLYLALVNNLLLANITFSSCGALFASASINTSSYMSVKTTDKMNAAVYVINSTNMTVYSTQFHSSTGIGLAVYNTNGNIRIIDCNFTDNHLPDWLNDSAGGGGMLLHYSYCTPGLTACDPTTNTHNSNSNITVHTCHFNGNKASSHEDRKLIIRDAGVVTTALGKGGGLQVVLAGHSSGNTVSLQNTVFYNNTADVGGALGLILKDNASSNTMTILACSLEGNTAADNGGALRAAIEFYDCDNCVSDNVLSVRDSEFVSNSAKWGGAVEFFSSQRNVSSPTNTLAFQNCTWDSNTADTAGIVDISQDAFTTQRHGFMPVPVFENCTFVNNTLSASQLGVLSVQSCDIHFQSHVHFHNNLGTALYLFDASVVILNGTVANFTNNTGTNGGAVTLFGSSALRLTSNTSLNFIGNKALEYGGAVYYYCTSPSLLYSFSCFIDYNMNTTNSTMAIYFADNEASVFGHAIYATTLLPCARAYGTGKTIDEKVQHVFTQRPFFYRYPYHHGLIGTTPHQLLFDPQKAHPLETAPGQPFQTGVSAVDELNQTVDAVIHTVITRGSEFAGIDSAYSYTADGIIQLTGIPNNSARVELSLQTIGPNKIKTSMRIRLTDCPSGYYLKQNSTHSVCQCSANVAKYQYSGISRCNADTFKAVLNNGYWAGCLDNGLFVTSQCPLGFCNHTSQDFVLPYGCEKVNEQLCGSMHRKGILCGECEENRTVYYHSNRYKCGQCDYPKLGLLFYALTELLPLTMVFFLIVIFGVSFTSGPANSFIFFAQVLNFFDVTSLGSLQFPETVMYLTSIYQFIFGAFNFDFFKLDIFSFCLWRGASIMDVFVFKYVTTAYAITLLAVFILAVRCIPRCYSCLQRCVFRPPVTTSLIQGISALLIISYTQCAKVSFQIMTAQSLRARDLRKVKTVVFLSGETDYFSYAHLPYAIPALFVIALTTIPPAVLIIHPTFTKGCRKDAYTLLAEVNEEHDRVSLFSRWQNRLTPFFDSFQGCFKDNCRYFAGLFFLYRLAISIAFAFSDNGMELYFTLEVIVIIMLALHAVVQPYQHSFFNKLDVAIFADLALINGMSIYNFYWAQLEYTKTVTVTSSIQLALIYLPLIYMSVVVLLKIGVRFKRVRRLKWIRRLDNHVPLFIYDYDDDYERLTPSSSFNEERLPTRLFEERAYHRPRPQEPAYSAIASARVTL